MVSDLRLAFGQFHCVTCGGGMLPPLPEISFHVEGMPLPLNILTSFHSTSQSYPEWQFSKCGLGNTRGSPTSFQEMSKGKNSSSNIITLFVFSLSISHKCKVEYSWGQVMCDTETEQIQKQTSQTLRRCTKTYKQRLPFPLTSLFCFGKYSHLS